MDENPEKIIWVLALVLLVCLSMYSLWGLLLAIPYALYMGAYFRGKNWILGWKEVKLTGRTV